MPKQQGYLMFGCRYWLTSTLSMNSPGSFNFPETLLKDIQQVCSINGDELIQAHNIDQPVSIRINPFKPITDFNSMEPVAWCEKSFYLPQRIPFIKDPLFHAGCYYVQEASSMFLETALKQSVDLSKDLIVLDLCAAPGGKSTLINSLLTDNSILISNEVIKTRIGPLAENMSKWGRNNCLVTNNDPKDFTPLETYFDVIVVDAPCSGSGLFRKQEDAIEHWSEENVLHCSQRQQRILEDIIPCLKPGGVLIYSTCSYSSSENEQIGDFILSTGNFTAIKLERPDSGIVETISEKGSYGYRFFPHLVKGEGFFIAAFQKSHEEPEVSHYTKKKLVTKPAKEELNLIAPFLSESVLNMVIKQKENFFLVNETIASELNLLLEHLNIRKKGTLIGELKGKDFIPNHELALSVHLNASVSELDVDEENALVFLKKSDIKARPETPRGFCIVRYKDKALGWIKNIGNRTNNYLPKEWRILTDVS
ncbi:MAG TPA: RNA methyltransferase [Bacteroidia bacterium]